MFTTNRMFPLTHLTIAALGLVLISLIPRPVLGATYTVADGDVAGLKAAINGANATAGPDTIQLAPNGIYTLTVIDNIGFFGSSGLPAITSEVFLQGNGATIQRSNTIGTPDFRILFVLAGNLTLDGVTLTGGRGDNSGGGLLLAGDCCTQSKVLLRNSTVSGNYGLEGGGIANFASTLIVENSTISYNTGFGGSTGGGILNASVFGPCCATTTINSSTIFENRADGLPGFQGRGDAIADAFSPAGSITVKNSVMASPTMGLGAACAFFTPVSGGHNIADDATCALTGSGDLNNTDPLLGPTVNNGGLTPTNLPLSGSPAIDAVPTSNCTDLFGDPLTSDQRGISRPKGAGCDIGSVEVVQALYQICLLYDPERAAKSGSTKPIKLQLCDGSGNNLSSSSITAHAVNITQTTTSFSGTVDDSGNANPDFDFRFDSALSTGGGYIFNLKTSGLPTGTFNVNFTVTGDSFVYSAPFQVK